MSSFSPSKCLQSVEEVEVDEDEKGPGAPADPALLLWESLTAGAVRHGVSLSTVAAAKIKEWSPNLEPRSRNEVQGSKVKLASTLNLPQVLEDVRLLSWQHSKPLFRGAPPGGNCFKLSVQTEQASIPKPRTGFWGGTQDMLWHLVSVLRRYVHFPQCFAFMLTHDQSL